MLLARPDSAKLGGKAEANGIANTGLTGLFHNCAKHTSSRIGSCVLPTHLAHGALLCDHTDSPSFWEGGKHGPPRRDAAGRRSPAIWRGPGKGETVGLTNYLACIREW